MKRFGFPALVALLFLLAFGIGFGVHFPTAAVTRAIEGGLNSATVLSVALSPVRMTLGGLKSERLVVREGGSPSGVPLMILTDVRVPFRPSLLRGAPLEANLGQEGHVSAFLAWNGTEVSIYRLAARLEDMALPVAAGVSIKGKVDLSGQFKTAPPRGARAELPEGEIRGKVEAVELSGMQVAGTKLPATKLDSVDLLVRTGRTVQIERFEAQGDLQGTAQGSITTNLDRPQDSRLNLTVAATLRPAWIQETGTLRPILEGFFPGGRIEGIVTGTAAAPSWNPGRGRR